MLQIGEAKIVLTSRYVMRKVDLLTVDLPASVRKEAEATEADAKGLVSVEIRRELPFQVRHISWKP